MKCRNMCNVQNVKICIHKNKNLWGRTTSIFLVKWISFLFIYTLHDADFVPAVTAYICIRWDTGDDKTSSFLWERAMPILLTLITFYIRGSQTFPAVPMLLRWQILVPKLLHFFKKVTTLFEKVTTFYLMIFLKNWKVTIFFKIARP